MEDYTLIPPRQNLVNPIPSCDQSQFHFLVQTYGQYSTLTRLQGIWSLIIVQIIKELMLHITSFNVNRFTMAMITLI